MTTSSSFAPSLILSLSLQLPHIPGMLLSSCLSLRVVMLSPTHSSTGFTRDILLEILSEIMESMCSRQSFSFSYLSLSQIISFKTSRFVGRRPLGSEEQGFPMRKYSGSGRIFFATTEAMNNDKRPFNGFLNISETINKSSRGKNCRKKGC